MTNSMEDSELSSGTRRKTMEIIIETKDRMQCALDNVSFSIFHLYLSVFSSSINVLNIDFI